MAEMKVELEDLYYGRGWRLTSDEETVRRVEVYKARKEYKKLLELAASLSNRKEAALLEIHALLHLKMWRQLLQVCERALQMQEIQLTAELLNLKGRAEGKLGNYKQKVRLTMGAIQMDSKVAAYHRNLGDGYYKLKQYERAIVSHDRAISLQSVNPINYHNKGAAFFRMRKFLAAVGCFQKAIELDPKQVVSFVWLADAYKELLRYQKAKENYLRAYELTDQYQYRQRAGEMEKRIQPHRKKSLFQRIFGRF